MFDNIRAKVLKYHQLAEVRNKNREKTIVFATGCYDILQSGHAVFFNQCKSYGDILVVGVGKDETLRQLKGPGRAGESGKQPPISRGSHGRCDVCCTERRSNRRWKN